MSAKEKENKKRGMLFALFFNGAIVALALFPLVRFMDAPVQDIELAQVDEKIYTELPTEFVVDKADRAAAEKPDPAPQPEPEPEPEPEPAPVEEPKEVVTTEEIKETPVPKPEKPNNNGGFKPAPPKPSPTPKPSSNTSNGTGNNANNSNGKGSVWSDDNGKGKFSREVVERDDRVKSLTKKHGTIVIRLAVDPWGKVVGAKYQKHLSSIKHDNLGKAVAHYLKNYKFSNDFKVKGNQYCNFTVTFDLDNKVRTKIK